MRERIMEAYDPGHFLDIARVGLKDLEMQFPVSLSVTDVDSA